MGATSVAPIIGLLVTDCASMASRPIMGTIPYERWKGGNTMIAGSYDYIEFCREEYGDEYVDHMLDSGYEPVHVPDRGWRWMLKSSEARNRVS